MNETKAGMMRILFKYGDNKLSNIVSLTLSETIMNYQIHKALIFLGGLGKIIY